MRSKYVVLSCAVLLALGMLFVFSGFLVPLERIDRSYVRAAGVIADSPIITGVHPTFSYNDMNTAVTISGSGFDAVISGTTVITQPQAYLGEVPLTAVTWVSSSTVDAVVPWGLQPGAYDISLVNPDGMTTTLMNAITLTQGINLFISNGPYGGQMMDLYHKPGSPETLFATAFGAGLFISQDAGANWQLVQDHDWPVHLSFDSVNPDVIYHGADSNDYFRSLDGGFTWERMLQIFNPQNGCSRYYPQAHPSLAGGVYMGVGSCAGIPLMPGEGGVFYSADYGDSWTPVNSDLTDLDVTVIAVNPQNPNNLLAGTYSGKVFVSSNGGAKWDLALDAGITIFRVWFNPYQPLQAWASAMDEEGNTDHALYRSDDLVDWDVVDVQAGTSRGGSPWNLFFESDRIWAAAGGVNYTENGGASWDEVQNLHHGGNAVSVQPGQPETVFVGDDWGVMKSADRGLEWFDSYNGLAGLVPEALAAGSDPLSGEDWVYVKTGQSLFRSTDGGSTWTLLDYGAGGFPQGEFLAVDPFDVRRVYLGVINECTGHACIDISTDGGQGWSVVSTTLPVEYAGWKSIVSAVAPHPSTPGLVFAGVNLYPSDSYPWADNTIGTVFRSADYGQSWDFIGPGQAISSVLEVRFDALDPNLVYVGTSGSGLWISDDGGAGWARAALPGLAPPVTVSAIEVHPDLSAKVYLRAYSFAVSPNPESELFKSLDGGQTWEQMGDVSLGKDLAITPHVQGAPRYTLYSGCEGAVCRSLDDGDTWSAVVGSPRPEILKVAGDEERSILYLGTPGGLLSGGAAPAAWNSPAGVSADTLIGGGVYRLVNPILNKRLFLPFVLRN